MNRICNLALLLVLAGILAVPLGFAQGGNELRTRANTRGRVLHRCRHELGVLAERS